MLQCRSALLAIASAFTGPYDPCRSIQFRQASGGVVALATDRASAIAIFDPKGHLTGGPLDLVPTDALIKACREIKTASRTLLIEDQASAARVITDYKAHAKGVDVPLGPAASVPFPDLTAVLGAVLERWGRTPAVSSAAGRYDLPLLKRLLDALGHDESVVLSAFDGGPLRVQREGLDAVALLMPQQAAPIPPLPDWLLALPQVETR